jgi:hypothetical protein
MLVVACLTCFIHLILILAHDYLLVILLWSSYVDSLLFCESWHNGVHNCLNTCLYALWSTLILNLMYSISFFSQFVFDESIAKGGEYGHKVDRTLANRVDERRNMINDYLMGRACIESVKWSWFQGECWFWVFALILSFSYSSELFLSLPCHFTWLCRFSCLLLTLAVFLPLDDILELFVGFWSSICASWGLGFKIQTLCLCCQWTHQEGDWETKCSVP